MGLAPKDHRGKYAKLIKKLSDDTHTKIADHIN